MFSVTFITLFLLKFWSEQAIIFTDWISVCKWALTKLVQLPLEHHAPNCKCPGFGSVTHKISMRLLFGYESATEGMGLSVISWLAYKILREMVGYATSVGYGKHHRSGVVL